MRIIRKKQTPRPRQRITSDKSVKLTTYYRSGSDTKNSQPAKRRKSRSKRYYHLADIVGVLAIFGLFAYSLLISNHPKVVASNTDFNGLNSYSKAASELMSGIESRNKITFNEANLTKKYKQLFPEINKVDVELPLLSPEAVIRLNIAKPIFILNNSGSLLVVGDSGRAIAQAKNYKNLSELPVINDETGYKAILGRQVLSEEGISFITELIAKTKAQGINIQSITLPPIPQELHLRTTDTTYYVKFLLSGNSTTQIGQFLAAKERFANGDKPSEYVDVRVPGKIYYK